MRKFASLLILLLTAMFVVGCSGDGSSNLATYKYLSQYGDAKINKISEDNIAVRLVVKNLYQLSPPKVCVDTLFFLHQDFPNASNFKCEIYQDSENWVIAYYDANDQYLSFNFKYFGDLSSDTYKASWEDLEKVSKNEVLLGDLPQHE